jgi:proton-translocating NADH-quinone oxidoreductase chain L
MLILIVLLPLLGFFSGSLFGRYLGRVVCIVTTLSVFLSFTLSFILFYQVLSTGVIYKLNVFPWIVVDSVHIDWCFCFDSLTSVMLVVVTFISSLVHLYSNEYMEHDPHLPRFMSYLSLFTFFMIILVTANNFLQMFVGWEGVGLCSYLLINFWFTRVQANKAAIKAMLVNRVGDFLLLMALFAIYFVFNSLDYDIVFCLTPLIVDSKIIVGSIEIPALDMICILLFFGAMGKSAQIGLHTWLPDAMEGPTPVSALIHAATMVTAGVFLIVRCSYLFEFSPLALNIIVCIGSVTAFFAATTGLFQNDMKRVIAYSTCSQLGYMVFACGLSSYDVGVFHLSNHAFFKALLFLGAGSIIHAVADEQDMRKMGGLKKILPFSYSIMVIGSLSLMGFPFLTGFYSKDTILEVASAKFTLWSHFSYYLGVVGACCTSFYSLRLLFLVFLAEPNGSKKVITNSHEPSWKMGLPLLILSIFSIFNGFVTREFFVGLGTQFWGASIFVLPQNYALVDVEFISLYYKLLPFFVSILGSLFAYLLYSLGLTSFLVLKKSERFKIIYNFLNRKWYFDRVYNEFVNQNGLHLSYHYVYKDVDRGLVEKIGPSGIIDTIKFTVNSFKHFQTGFMFHYLFIFTFSIIMLILFFIVLCSSPITLKILFFLSVYLIF